jgi:hypothetical protein
MPPVLVLPTVLSIVLMPLTRPQVVPHVFPLMVCLLTTVPPHVVPVVISVPLQELSLPVPNVSSDTTLRLVFVPFVPPP